MLDVTQLPTRVIQVSEINSGPLNGGLGNSPANLAQANVVFVSTEGGSTANEIELTPSGDISATDLQAAIYELDAEKLSSDYELSVDPLLIYQNNRL